jgi:hypothetical protein
VGRVLRLRVRTPPSTPAFDFEELRFDHGDVLIAAIGWGEWQMLERSLAQGLACESDAEARGEDADPGELRAAVVAFRRARRLLAGEDYLDWLRQRSLTTADVGGYFKRAMFRRRAERRIDDILVSHPPSAERIAETIDAEAILGGRLRSWSERLARCAGARRGLDGHDDRPPMDASDWLTHLLVVPAACRSSGLSESAIRDRAPRLAELLAAEAVFRDLVVTPALIEQRVDEHRLDWQRFVWSEVVFTSEGAAREAALMVREDGMELGAVAAFAHADSSIREAYWSDVPELASLLSGSGPDELVGPLPTDGRWRLIEVRECTAASAEDPKLRGRVIDELIDDALGRQLAGRLTWHARY